MPDHHPVATRVAVVARRPPLCRPEDADGFSFRYWYIVDQLAQTGEVLLVYLRDPPSPTMIGSPVSGNVILKEVNCAGPETAGHWAGRRWRMRAIARAILRTSKRPDWEEEMQASVRDWGADVVIALTNYTPSDVVRLARDFPAIVFVEEDLSIHPGSARSRRVRAQALAAIEHWANKSYVRRLTADVVVISPSEQPWAIRSFPTSAVHLVPHFVDFEYWREPVLGHSAVHSDVFVVGAMEQARNAEGLASVLAQLETQLPADQLPLISVASRWAPHPSLANCRYPRLRHLGSVDDVRPHYAGATVTLVPSFVVSGAKTTILQGWATETAVVTTTSAAESIGGADGRDLLEASTPPGVAAQLIRLLASPDMRVRLVAEGRLSLVNRHSPVAAMSRLRDLVADRCSAPRVAN